MRRGPSSSILDECALLVIVRCVSSMFSVPDYAIQVVSYHYLYDILLFHPIFVKWELTIVMLWYVVVLKRQAVPIQISNLWLVRGVKQVIKNVQPFAMIVKVITIKSTTTIVELLNIYHFMSDIVECTTAHNHPFRSSEARNMYLAIWRYAFRCRNAFSSIMHISCADSDAQVKSQS